MVRGRRHRGECAVSYCPDCQRVHPHGAHTRPFPAGHPAHTPDPVPVGPINVLRCATCDEPYIVANGHVCGVVTDTAPASPVKTSEAPPPRVSAPETRQTVVICDAVWSDGMHTMPTVRCALAALHAGKHSCPGYRDWPSDTPSPPMSDLHERVWRDSRIRDLEEQLAAVEARWAARVQTLEARLRRAVDMLEGRT